MPLQRNLSSDEILPWLLYILLNVARCFHLAKSRVGTLFKGHMYTRIVSGPNKINLKKLLVENRFCSKKNICLKSSLTKSVLLLIAV